MTKLASLTALGLLITLAASGYAGQAPARSAPSTRGAERFEVSSIKAVRPALVKTIASLHKRDVAGAREAFEAYDSAWNGIEVHINIRSNDMYDDLEHNYQSKLAAGLDAPKPDAAALLAQAQSMLAKYDEAIRLVEQGKPFNRLYDDVARLRIVRADLRAVNPALKAGTIAKARTSFGAFNDIWDSIEDLVKARSRGPMPPSKRA